jgi:hypothetical protein
MDPIDIDEVLSKLTLDQKSALVAGAPTKPEDTWL